MHVDWSRLQATDQVHLWSVTLGKRIEIDRCPHVYFEVCGFYP